jgi:hypothetical protein
MQQQDIRNPQSFFDISGLSHADGGNVGNTSIFGDVGMDSLNLSILQPQQQ